MVDDDGDAAPGLRGRDHRRRVRDARRRDRPRGRQAGRGGAAADDPLQLLVTNLAILVLAGFVGYEVISKVPNTLHTPLMSGTNAIHGIVVLGGLLVIGRGGRRLVQQAACSSIAIVFGTINVVGGFLVTDRMLGMFKSKPKPQAEAATRRRGSDRRSRRRSCRTRTSSTSSTSSPSSCSSRPARADRPEDGGARQQDRGGRHGDRGRSRRC